MKSSNMLRDNGIGEPDNRRLGIDDLPPAGTKRWVIRRKAEVVAGVRSGIITLEDACERYTLSVEEFLSWQRSIDQHGVRGLRTTRLQEYRGPAEESSAQATAEEFGQQSADSSPLNR